MSRPTVLVVEDNKDNMTLIADILTSMDYDILQARNGQQGVEKAEEAKPDLILMDLSLPVMDGWSATRMIKSNPDLSHIPVIALTAHALQGDKEKAFEAGCDDYLSKPLNLAALMEKLKTYLEG